MASAVETRADSPRRHAAGLRGLQLCQGLSRRYRVLTTTEAIIESDQLPQHALCLRVETARGLVVFNRILIAPGALQQVGDVYAPFELAAALHEALAGVVVLLQAELSQAEVVPALTVSGCEARRLLQALLGRAVIALLVEEVAVVVEHLRIAGGDAQRPLVRILGRLRQALEIESQGQQVVRALILGSSEAARESSAMASLVNLSITSISANK